MRQLFSVFLFSFASLFFSQCEIGEISFSLEDVLMFFKVERPNKKDEIQIVEQKIVLKKPRPVVVDLNEPGQNKKDKIQENDEIELKADERPENEIQEIDKFVIEAAKKPENIIQKVYEMNVLKEPRPKNIPQSTNEVTILGLEKPENVVESIDEIEIKAAERPENEIQKIAEIELKAKEKEQNIIQKTQEIIIPAKQRAENVIGRIESIELLGIEKPQIKPELTNNFYLQGVVKPENEIEGEDEILIEGNNDEEVINANPNVNSEESKSNDTITPRHKRNLSDVSGSSLYSEWSTTASKNNSCINNLAYHNVDKKGVFDSDGNLYSLKRDLINSFNGAQTDEGYSCGAIEIIKKQNPLVNNIGEQPKRKCNGGYFDLIRKKIKEQEDQKCTLSLIREKEGSSIFVPRCEFMKNNKIYQEGGNNIFKEVKNSRIGDKKDDKNVNISEKMKYWGSNIFKLLNLNKKTEIKKNNSKLHFNILQKENTQKENIGQSERKNKCNNAKNLRQYKQIEGDNDKYAGISSTEYDTLISEKELNVNNKYISVK